MPPKVTDSLGFFFLKVLTKSANSASYLTDFILTQKHEGRWVIGHHKVIWARSNILFLRKKWEIKLVSTIQIIFIFKCWFLYLFQINTKNEKSKLFLKFKIIFCLNHFLDVGAEILQIFGVVFWKFLETKNSFWNQLIFICLIKYFNQMLHNTCNTI